MLCQEGCLEPQLYNIDSRRYGRHGFLPFPRLFSWQTVVTDLIITILSLISAGFACSMVFSDNNTALSYFSVICMACGFDQKPLSDMPLDNDVTSCPVRSPRHSLSSLRLGKVLSGTVHSKSGCAPGSAPSRSGTASTE